MYLKYFLESGIFAQDSRFIISYAILFRDGPLASTGLASAFLTTYAVLQSR